MVCYEVASLVPVAAPCGTLYDGMAFDGEYFYLSAADGILKLGRSPGQAEKIHTVRQYRKLCYDFKNDCFWAVAAGVPGMLFQLSHALIEMDRRLLPGACTAGCDCVTGLCWDNCRQSVLIVYPDHLCMPDCGVAEGGRLDLPCRCVRGAMPLCPFYVLTERSGRGQRVALLGPEDERSVPVPSDYFIRAMVLDPYQPPCDGWITVFLLLIKHSSYPYLAQLKVAVDQLPIAACNFLCPPCIPCPPCGGNSCWELMESAVRTENQIAQLLNEEGKLLQRGVAKADCTCALLCLNDSLIQTIAHATELEIAATNRLREIAKCCCPCGCHIAEPCMEQPLP